MHKSNISQDKFNYRGDRSNPLPGVPLCEQPFFSDYFHPDLCDPITYQVAKNINENGYAILRFPDEEIELVADRIISSLRDRYDWTAWREGRSALRLTDAWKWNEDVRRIATNERILRILAEVYGRNALPFQTLNFPVGTQQHFHTDSVHFSSMPERWMCGVWLALEDIHMDAGPLVYFPGSHKWPIYVNEHIGHIHTGGATGQPVYEYLWERLVEHYDVKPERLAVPKGSALIWAANLLHGGDEHRDKSRSRWSQVTHYYFEGCAYYTPMHSDPPLGSIGFREPVNILTGKPLVNTYIGERIDPEYIRAVDPTTQPQTRMNLPKNFDPVGYLRLNPDVASSGMSAENHYVIFGRNEGRKWG